MVKEPAYNIQGEERKSVHAFFWWRYEKGNDKKKENVKEKQEPKAGV
jgi:hypothetical protein